MVVELQKGVVSLLPSRSPVQRRCCVHTVSKGARPGLFRSAPCELRATVRQRTSRPFPVLRAEPESSSDKEYNTEFGYSRKDVLIIGVGLLALGFGINYGLQAAGVDALTAGSWSQLIIFVGGLVAWVLSYVFRVATKNMTYVKQLEDYEEAVMKKRLEEMTDVEVEEMTTEIEQEKNKGKGLQ